MEVEGTTQLAEEEEQMKPGHAQGMDKEIEIPVPSSNMELFKCSHNI